MQYLRGVAALAIVVFHAADRGKITIVALEGSVDLFFVLSGFLMAMITSDDTRPGQFLVDRVMRVVPPYWIVTTVMLLGYYAGAFRYLQIEFWHVLSSYFFIPAMSPAGEMFPLLVPGWTLNYEMFFYGVFALLLVIPRREFLMPALTIVFVGLVLLGWTLTPGTPIAKSFTDSILLDFLGGAWLGSIWKRSPFGSPGLGWALLGVGTALIVFSGTVVDGTAHRAVFFGAPCLVLLLGVLCLERRPGGIPAFGLPLLLGDASYSIYLWHTIVIGLVAKVCEKVGMPTLALVTIASCAGTIGGVFAFKLIEEPILNATKRRKRRQLPGILVPAT